jgi:hypothetical protein
MDVPDISEEQYREAWAKITATAWEDSQFKQRLLSNPKPVLAEFGIPFPADYNVRVVEESQDPGTKFQITETSGGQEVVMRLRNKPAAVAEGELSDSQLEAVAGGSGDCCCSCCPTCCCT